MKKIFLFITSLFIGLSPLTAVLADNYGLSEAAPNALQRSANLPSMIGTVLGSVLGFTGTIFFVLVIYAGLMWMTSAGNEEQVKKSQKILFAAIAGLIIILSAYAITRFIGSALTSSN